MAKISRLFICMFFLFFTTLVNANSLILKQKEFYEPGFHLYFLKDPSGKLTIDDVNSEKWSSQFEKNTKKVPRFGFTKSTIWLRIKVINNSPEKNWLFNISLPTLDKVTFFKKENGWVKTFGGDTLPSDQWETRYKDIIFSLSKNRESTYFFKIKNRGGTNVPMTLMSKKYFQNYKQNYDLFYGGYFMVLIIMFFYNLVMGIHLRSTAYMLFVGYLFSWTFLSLAITGFGRYVVTDWVSFSNEGMPFFISCAFLFFISFVRKFLDIKEKNYNLDRFFYYLILFSGGFISLTPFLNLRHSLIIVALFGGFASLLIFSSIVSFFKTSRSARIAAFSFSVILLGAILKVLSGTGITPVTFLSEQGILIGALVQLIFLSLGLADRFKSIQELALEREKEVSDILEDNLKKERALSNLLEDARAGLTRAIEKRTRETKDLLDNMNSAVFAIGNDGKILNPVSKCSEKIFKKKIVGKKISEVLYYNIKKGTKEYSDIVSVFALIFGESDLQFLALADNLPTKVQLPIDEKGKNIMLKLSYAPILDDEGLVYKVLCIAEDVTGSEEYYLESFDSVLNMQFLKEISENDNKEELSKKLAYFVEEGFKILEDFVSPLSDTYEYSYFKDELRKYNKIMENEKEDLKVLLPMCKDKIWNFFEIDERTVKVDHQKEATNIICDILDDFLKYVGSASIFFKINFRIRETSLERVIESIKSLEAHFKNLFEYVFLVRKIQSIDEGKLKKVVQVAKLYPDFERSIDLIHQRARLINLLLKGIGESELALVYGKLASLVKLMPERSRLDESIIKNNLIDPYKNILEKIEGIETELPKRVKEREVKIMDEKGYFIFLMGIITRFVMESEKGAHPKLPSLPKIEEIETKKLKTLLSEMRKGDVIFKEEKAILKLTYEIEDVLRRVFKDALVESNIYPFDKSNRKLIEFLKSYMFDQSLKKRKAS